MSEIKNKRLYEEDLVKKLITIALVDAMDANVKKDEINKFVKEQFDVIVQKIINKDG